MSSKYALAVLLQQKEVGNKQIIKKLKTERTAKFDLDLSIDIRTYLYVVRIYSIMFLLFLVCVRCFLHLVLLGHHWRTCDCFRKTYWFARL